MLRLVMYLLFSVNVWADSFVVIESTSAAYQAASELSSRSDIDLKAGESLQLISESGTVFELIGPYRGTAKVTTKIKKPISLASAMKKLMSKDKGDGSDFGAIRAGSAESSAKVWDVPVGYSGPVCFVQGKPLHFFRSDVLQPERIYIAWASKKKKSVFRAGKNRKKWKIPTINGQVYTVTAKSLNSISRITLLQLPKAVFEKPQMGAFLLAKGCARQASIFVHVRP